MGACGSLDGSRFVGTLVDVQVMGHRLTGSGQRHIVGIVGIGMHLDIRMYKGEEQGELSAARVDHRD